MENMAPDRVEQGPAEMVMVMNMMKELKNQMVNMDNKMEELKNQMVNMDNRIEASTR